MSKMAELEYEQRMAADQPRPSLREAAQAVIDRGESPHWTHDAEIIEFYIQVAAAEREACAQIAEDEWSYFSTECGSDVAKDIAAAIRARGQE
jgi:hypothetical protein